MKKFISLKGYENSYNKHLEEITRLQELLAIEEQKLFELIQTKKQMFGYKERWTREKPIMASNQAQI